MPRILLAGLIALMLVISGCKIGGHNSSSSNAGLRVANLAALIPTVNSTGTITTSTSVDMSINSTAELSGLTFESISPYVGYASGSSDIIALSVSGGGAVLVSQTFTFNSGTNYTLVVYGSNGQPGTVLLADTAPNSPSSGYFQIRPVNTAQGSAGLDFYVLPLAANNNGFSSATATFPSNGIGGVPLFQQFIAGQYVLYVAASGSKDILYQSSPITFNNQDTVTADIFSTGSSSLVNTVLMYQNTAETTVLEPSLVSQFKVTNASPTAGPINVAITPPASAVVPAPNLPVSLAYGTSSSYVLIDSSATNLNFISTNSSANTQACSGVVSQNCVATIAAPNFAGASDYSTVLVGSPPSTNMLILPDNNLSPQLGYVKMRFVNASTAAAVNVQVNNLTYPSGLAANTASIYYDFPQNLLPGYTITAQVVGSSATVLTVSGVEVTEGATYTVYIMGTSGSMQAYVTLDNS